MLPLTETDSGIRYRSRYRLDSALETTELALGSGSLSADHIPSVVAWLYINAALPSSDRFTAEVTAYHLHGMAKLTSQGETFPPVKMTARTSFQQEHADRASPSANHQMKTTKRAIHWGFANFDFSTSNTDAHPTRELANLDKVPHRTSVFIGGWSRQGTPGRRLAGPKINTHPTNVRAHNTQSTWSSCRSEKNCWPAGRIVQGLP